MKSTSTVVLALFLFNALSTNAFAVEAASGPTDSNSVLIETSDQENSKSALDTAQKKIVHDDAKAVIIKGDSPKKEKKPREFIDQRFKGRKKLHKNEKLPEFRDKEITSMKFETKDADMANNWPEIQN